MNIGTRFGATLALAFALAAPLFTIPGTAVAATPVYDRVEDGQNHVGFVFRQMGVPVEGRFRKVTADLSFDPETPENSRVRLELDLVGIDTGSSEGNEEVVTRPWLNLKVFPVAVFESKTVRALGDDRFEVVGDLNIKGTTREVVAPFTVTYNGDTAIFEGSFTLKRLEFAVGDGIWADTSVVADEVEIRFRTAAARAG